MSIPLKQSPEGLGDSLSLATKQFHSLERKLARDSLLKQLYSVFLQEYLELGHMSHYSISSDQEVKYYVPYHGVLGEQSLTTKLEGGF